MNDTRYCAASATAERLVCHKMLLQCCLCDVYFNCTGDVDGSLEAILDILETYNSPQCQLHLLNYGVGNISESDIEMAATFNGMLSVCKVDHQ